jgi:uncharacterized protein YndB with AHSA1/START domain
VTEVHAHDQGFVAAPPERVYEVLADLTAYPHWWRAAAAVDGEVRLRLSGRVPSSASAERRRPALGLYLRLGAPTAGTLEWYLEPFEEGTVVNCLLDLDLRGRSRRAQAGLRRARSEVRRGLVALKRELE